MSNTDDRAVQALLEATYESDLLREITVTADDLAAAAAIVLRVVRDDIVMAWQAGDINDLLGAERLLNARIRSLTGRDTTTGDTT